ncbi:MAG TPA: CDP-alcohol phosphatidyltransferase family protein [Acidimicrobiia bacterium]|nr:CDP-alcohol phosphatidyltransferase family protein [Acidimicrobiia bacterium]
MTHSERGAPEAGSAILTLPNVVSFVRLLMIPLFLWLLLVRDEVAGAGWLLGIIGATDWVDGYLARRLDQVSEVGKFLDPLADRLAVAAALVGGLIAGVLEPWFAWALIVREGMIAVGALFLGARLGAKLAVRDLGKLATLMLYAAIAWLFIGIGTPWPWLETIAWIVAIPGLILYYVVGAQYFMDARALLAEEKAGTEAG